VALAVIVTVDPVAKSALLAGPVNDMAGGVFELLTVTVIGADVVVAPLSSVAFAVNVYVPAATLFHTKLCGPERSSPSFVVPLKNSTLLTDPSESAAFALMVIAFPATNVALFAGLEIETDGGALGGVTGPDPYS
jgi:hypothetical protein